MTATSCSSPTGSTARSYRSTPRRVPVGSLYRPRKVAHSTGRFSVGRADTPDASRLLIEVDLASGSIAGVDTLDGAINPFVAEVAFGDLWVLDYGGERDPRIKP